MLSFILLLISIFNSLEYPTVLKPKKEGKGIKTNVYNNKEDLKEILSRIKDQYPNELMMLEKYIKVLMLKKTLMKN